MEKIFLILSLSFFSAQALGAVNLICGDRSRDTHLLDITGAQSLPPGASFKTQIKFKPFRSAAYSIGSINCVRPAGNHLTAERQPILICKGGEYEATVQADDEGKNLFIDFYRNANLIQEFVPCLLTEGP